MTDEQFIEICQESQSMAVAASKLNLHFNTFKKRAVKLNCYKPNQSGKGLNKIMPEIDVKEILNGDHPHYQSFKLKNKLFKFGYKENKCEICGVNKWMGKDINCELDHIDGDRTNHKLENLRILCPNCHSQTETFRSKNIKTNL